jgi:hypothetical protein
LILSPFGPGLIEVPRGFTPVFAPPYPAPALFKGIPDPFMVENPALFIPVILLKGLVEPTLADIGD